MRLAEMVAPLCAPLKLNFRDVPVRDVTDDSRAVHPGSLFVAVDGVAADGHRFLHDAVRRGAVAVVSERLPWPMTACPTVMVPDSRRALSSLAATFHGRPADRMTIVGVTGTDAGRASSSSRSARM